MRKCTNCELVFYAEDRYECPYCNSTLVEATEEDVAGGKKVYKEDVKDWVALDLERLHYVVGSFLRAKSFVFLYALSRNQLKMGKRFSRFFIYPLGFGFIIKLPWLIIDVVDSLFFRFLYSGYCPECGWKHKLISGGMNHSGDECAYNKEYQTFLNDILTGRIEKTEERFKKEASEKAAQGKKSAYLVLTAPQTKTPPIFDITAILISLGLIIFLVVKLSLPIFADIYDF